MITNNANLLLIDDDVLHLDILSRKLSKIGYKNINIASSCNEATEILTGLYPDLILIDFYLDGNNTAKHFIKDCLAYKNIPIIIISTFYGNEHFDDIKSISPMDFIPKSLSDFDLIKSIELALYNKAKQTAQLQMKNYIFVKNNKEIKKVNLKDIYYITVDRKYLEIHTNDKRYIIRSTLTDFEKRLPETFVKIHKAYIINLAYMDSILVEEGIVKLGDKTVPLSRNFKKELLSSYYFS